VAYFTVTVELDAADRVTAKVPLPGDAALPSAKLMSPMASDGSGAASSLVMVPTPVPSAMVAPEAPDSRTFKVSLLSTAVSPDTWTRIVLDVSPAANVTVPLAAV